MDMYDEIGKPIEGVKVYLTDLDIITIQILMGHLIFHLILD